MPKLYDALVVDDEKDICEICTDYLENMGCFRHIITAADGVLATTKLNNQKFDIILLDINLPKKSGTKILKQFGEGNKNIIESVIVISGELNKSVIAEAMKAGVKHFLVKPFDEAAVQSKVLQVLKSLK